MVLLHDEAVAGVEHGGRVVGGVGSNAQVCVLVGVKVDCGDGDPAGGSLRKEGELDSWSL